MRDARDESTKEEDGAKVSDPPPPFSKGKAREDSVSTIARSLDLWERHGSGGGGGTGGAASSSRELALEVGSSTRRAVPPVSRGVTVRRVGGVACIPRWSGRARIYARRLQAPAPFVCRWTVVARCDASSCDH